MFLNIDTQQRDGVTLVRLSGRIALGRESQEIEWKIDDLLRENRKQVVFDISEVNYLDSTGVGILVMASGKLQSAGGALHVAGSQGVVHNTLTMTRVNEVLRLFPDAESAMAAFQPAASA